VYHGDKSNNIIANSCGNKAECLRLTKRFNNALPFYDQALSIQIKVYGENHLTVATTLNNKAFCFQSLGRIDEAQTIRKTIS
jgi:hypothetical protein